MSLLHFGRSHPAALVAPAPSRPCVWRVGVCGGVLGVAPPTAMLSGMFPAATFRAIEGAWPERGVQGLDLLIVGLNGADPAEVERMATRIAASAGRVEILVVLGGADIETHPADDPPGGCRRPACAGHRHHPDHRAGADLLPPGHRPGPTPQRRGGQRAQGRRRRRRHLPGGPGRRDAGGQRGPQRRLPGRPGPADGHGRPLSRRGRHSDADPGPGGRRRRRGRAAGLVASDPQQRRPRPGRAA
jgi:hypothetical protein